VAADAPGATMSAVPVLHMYGPMVVLAPTSTEKGGAQRERVKDASGPVQKEPRTHAVGYAHRPPSETDLAHVPMEAAPPAPPAQ
jgi:hypothetical protein